MGQALSLHPNLRTMVLYSTTILDFLLYLYIMLLVTEKTLKLFALNESFNAITQFSSSLVVRCGHALKTVRVETKVR